MKQLNVKDLPRLLEKRQAPCLSLYQSTHRSHPENAQDPIRFKNLVKQLEQSLLLSYDTATTQELLKPFRDLEQDTSFWQHTLDGIAVLADKNECNVYQLQRKVPDFAVVADSWHIKPLLRQTQTQDRYQVLCVTRSAIALFEGNRDELDAVMLDADFPDHIDKALGSELTKPYKKVSSYGLGPAAKSGAAMHHGHGGKSEAVEIDIERFFRIVDKSVYDHISKQSQLPLILVTLAEYQGIFRKLSHNAFLLEQGISIDPESLTVEQLRHKTWELMEPLAATRIQELVAKFKQANGTGLASDNLELIVGAILDGRVDTLLIDADEVIAGKIDRENRSIEFSAEFSAADVEDVLDDLGEMVLRRGGTVKVVPKKYMPTDTGAAAIYRF